MAAFAFAWGMPLASISSRRRSRRSEWIGNTYLDDSGRDSPASLNSTGDM